MEPVYVLEFAAEADAVDIIWVLERLTNKRSDGGADLSIQCARPSLKKVTSLCKFLNGTQFYNLTNFQHRV